MGAETGVVQLLDCVLHVLIAQVLHHARAVLEDVCEANIASLAHVVFQVLPAARGRQACRKRTQLACWLWVYL